MALEINGLPPASGTGPINKTTTPLPAQRINNQTTQAIQLSETAITLQKVMEQFLEKSAAHESPVDSDKVNAYRKAITQGSYVVNAQSIAKNLLKLDGLF